MVLNSNSADISIVDCWSVGTILAELLGGKPIFKGRDYVDQLNQVSLPLRSDKKELI